LNSLFSILFQNSWQFTIRIFYYNQFKNEQHYQLFFLQNAN
jgi:hypothetical protein